MISFFSSLNWSCSTLVSNVTLKNWNFTYLHHCSMNQKTINLEKFEISSLSVAVPSWLLSSNSLLRIEELMLEILIKISSLSFLNWLVLCAVLCERFSWKLIEFCTFRKIFFHACEKYDLLHHFHYRFLRFFFKSFKFIAKAKQTRWKFPFDA